MGLLRQNLTMTMRVTAKLGSNCRSNALYVGDDVLKLRVVIFLKNCVSGWKLQL